MNIANGFIAMLSVILGLGGIGLIVWIFEWIDENHGVGWAFLALVLAIGAIAFFVGSFAPP